MVVAKQLSLLERADLRQPIPENVRKLTELVKAEERSINVGDHDVYLRECRPPGGNYSKCVVLFLHGQSFSSSTWDAVMPSVAAIGYHCIALDMPGSGRTRGPAIAQEDKPTFILRLISALGAKQVMVVAASMSSQYILPLLAMDIFICVVGIALSNTHEITQYSAYKTPILVVWGDRDTSIGPTAASNLKDLPNSRLERIENAGHAAYLNNPTQFIQLCINFFELIRNYHSCS